MESKPELPPMKRLEAWFRNKSEEAFFNASFNPGNEFSEHFINIVRFVSMTVAIGIFHQPQLVDKALQIRDLMLVLQGKEKIKELLPYYQVVASITDEALVALKEIIGEA